MKVGLRLPQTDKQRSTRTTQKPARGPLVYLIRIMYVSVHMGS